MSLRKLLLTSASHGLGSPLPYALKINRGAPSKIELEIEKQREQDRAQGASVSLGFGSEHKRPVRYDE